MDQEVLFKNSVGALYAIKDNFLYLKYTKSVELQKDDFEVFILHLSEYVQEHGKFALIVEIPSDTTFSEATIGFIAGRKYHHHLNVATAVVGNLSKLNESIDLNSFEKELSHLIPTKSFPSFIEAFQWIQQYLPM